MNQSRVLSLITVSCLVFVSFHRASADDIRYEGQTVKEWIADWDANDYKSNHKAVAALVAIGTPAVDELTKLVTERHRHSGLAIQSLAKMGDKARSALPVLLELAADKHAANPEGWTQNVPIRALLFLEARNMGWAADQWVPVLARVAGDASEPEIIRLRATHALGGMGASAEPTLKALASHDDRAIRQAANGALAAAAIAGGRSKSEVFEEIVAKNPLDANVPHYLVRTKGAVNLGWIHPPTQRVKAALRGRLAAQPDAETAWTLATIIRNGLSNTDLLFDAPSDGGRTKLDREDPNESYATLAEALETGLKVAPPDSESARRFGLSLARLRLLQGNWAGMNAVLEKLGQPPILESRRSSLPAPPPDWSNLDQDWQPADESMRSGTCAIEFEFEKDGKGLAGAHVLVKHPRDPKMSAYTGVRVDTLLHATQPLEEEKDPSLHNLFGYHASDRAMTRYAVSDSTGKVRIEGLPKIPIVVEVLIPTSNFHEPGNSWDLVMEIVPGDIRPTSWGEADSVRSKKEGPTVVELKENDTIHYPKLIVRPQLALNVVDWSPVNATDFVLEWESLQRADLPVDHYEVEMMLTAPSQIPHLISTQRAIQSTTEKVLDTRWEVGTKGIGGQRLCPGNIYMFEVRALDPQGKVIARLPRTRVWVPWAHRESSPPAHGPRAINEVPIHDRVWWQGASMRHGGARVELREAVADYLLGSDDRFEFEYVLLGQAWLNCLDGSVEADRQVLKQLVQDLPVGNVVRGTARALLKQLDEGTTLPKRLEFVADE